MPTIPTGQMERELRALYLRWLRGVSLDTRNLGAKVDQFHRQSQALIERMGGQTASLGALAGFPVPKRLDLSPHIGTIYSDMQQSAIQAGMMVGLNSVDTARQMFNAGMDKSFNRLKRLARTETVSAYWKNAWDSVADLPALVMVWGSEDGPRTCAWCRERDGMVMESSSLRDHPNGRCTPIPKLRSEVDYRGSIRGDGTIYHDPRWREPRATGLQEVDAPLGHWQPVMSEAEAKSWAGPDAKYVKSFYHGTSDSVANRIMAEGFSLDAAGTNTGTAGLYGRGIYLAPGKEVAEMYTPTTGGAVLEIKTNIKNPMQVSHSEAIPGFAEFRDQWFEELERVGFDFPVEEAVPRAIQAYAESLGHDSIIRVEKGQLSELVLFDKKQAVIVKKIVQ